MLNVLKLVLFIHAEPTVLNFIFALIKGLKSVATKFSEATPLHTDDVLNRFYVCI